MQVAWWFEENLNCTMPEHGRTDAKVECCRPKVTHSVTRPISNTFNCLIGCSIGNFLVLFYLQMEKPHLSMHAQMLLAVAAGLATSVALETLILTVKEKFGWSNAFRTALSMSFISMLAMEIAETLTDVALTNGRVDLSSAWWWFALVVSLFVGFLAPLPYNYWKFKKHGVSCH